jgi:hypothetical protein
MSKLATAWLAAEKRAAMSSHADSPSQADTKVCVRISRCVANPFLNDRDNKITPLWQSSFLGLRQRVGHLVTGKVRAVAGSAGLLPPRFCNGAGINRIETGVLDECQPYLSITVAVSRNGDGNPVTAPFWLPLPREGVRTDCVPCLDDGAV